MFSARVDVMSCKVPMVSCMQWVWFHTYICPWSWGLGVRVSTEERGLSGCGEVRATPVQEKVGGVPLSQAHGTAQVKLVGWPDARVPWT